MKLDFFLSFKIWWYDYFVHALVVLTIDIGKFFFGKYQLESYGFSPGRKLQDLDFSTKVPFILIELTGEAVGDFFERKCRWKQIATNIDNYRYV